MIRMGHDFVYFKIKLIKLKARQGQWFRRVSSGSNE